MAHKHRISGTQEYLHQRYCDLFLQRISKLGLISRLAIDFEFQSKIVRNRSLPVARNRYPLPGYRNGVPCFHWDIRFLENLSVRLDSSTKKTFFSEQLLLSSTPKDDPHLQVLGPFFIMFIYLSYQYAFPARSISEKNLYGNEGRERRFFLLCDTRIIS